VIITGAQPHGTQETRIVINYQNFRFGIAILLVVLPISVRGFCLFHGDRCFFSMDLKIIRVTQSATP
jgi:hypothetical protein